ncbi:MAG: methyl-accepting chemotaxis protein [Candidatus Cohnella colombiensis]|uniref:Methyl-accepting chemotaxis protein n=1 Tax=Candidatus Cohnella colombiensis TaxID=3121368 RepID=A0AA95F1V9_9BACL|nr:MAG: methyl-accepting chemotaxis protein [Cohnella sp.]
MKKLSPESKGKRFLGTVRNLFFRSKITHRMIVLLLILTIVNGVAGVIILSQNSNVKNEVANTQRFNEIEAKYNDVSTLMNASVLLYVDVLENYTKTRKEKLDNDLAKIPDMITALEATLIELDKETESVEYRDSFGSLAARMKIAYDTLMKEHNQYELIMSESNKQLMRARTLGIYFEKLSKIDEDAQARFEKAAEPRFASLTEGVKSSNRAATFNFILLTLLPVLSLIGLILQIRKNLSGIMKHIAAFTNNDFTYDRQLKAYDEFGMIDEMLREMGKNLRRTITSTVTVSQQVLETSDQMQTLLSNNQKAADTAQQAVAASKQGMMIQSESNMSISSVTEEVSASSEQITASCQSINSDMQNMRDASQMGTEKMHEVVQLVNDTTQEFKTLSEVMRVMTERYGNVVHFLESINGITTQTNLLSLNASIEAARAGEYGSGFAVVAGEIRKLSGQTSELSKKIAVDLNQIHSDMKKSEVSLNSFEQLMMKTKQISESSNSTFIELEHQSGILADQMNEITQAMSEISTGMISIVTSVEQMADTSLEVREGMDTVTQLSEKQNNISNDLIEMADTLKSTSHDLREQLSAFKI